MKGVLTRTREAWVKSEFGARARFTVKRFRLVCVRLAERGFLIAAETDGPALEHVTAVCSISPGFLLVKQYLEGKRQFRRDEVAKVIGVLIDSLDGITRVATLGFALEGADADHVELLATDAKEAQLINETRLGRTSRGIETRRAIETILKIRSAKRTRVNITETRRILTAETLEKRWLINGESLLDGGKRSRLRSKWTFKDFNGNGQGSDSSGN